MDSLIGERSVIPTHPFGKRPLKTWVSSGQHPNLTRHNRQRRQVKCCLARLRDPEQFYATVCPSKRARTVREGRGRQSVKLRWLTATKHQPAPEETKGSTRRSRMRQPLHRRKRPETSPTHCRQVTQPSTTKDKTGIRGLSDPAFTLVSFSVRGLLHWCAPVNPS